MPNLNIDEILQHELQIARLASGQINSVVIPSLESTYAEIRRLISESGLPETRGELRALESAIRKAIQDNAGWGDFTKNAHEFAVYESTVYQGIIGALTGTTTQAVAEGKLERFINNALMTLESGSRVQSGTWAQFVQANIDSRTKEINNIIRTGYARGWPISRIGREMRNRFDGVLLREAEALARTGYSHYANTAREALSEQFDFALEWVLVFTFDSRISQVCLGLSTMKHRWDINDPKKRVPPFHFNCRTVAVVVPEGTEIVGTRASVGMNADGEAVARQIRASTSYEDFLRRQPVEFQNEVLGVKKARLFRSGELELRGFFDMTGRELTLDELKQRDPDIWRSVFG